MILEQPRWAEITEIPGNHGSFQYTGCGSSTSLEPQLDSQKLCTVVNSMNFANNRYLIDGLMPYVRNVIARMLWELDDYLPPLRSYLLRRLHSLDVAVRTDVVREQLFMVQVMECLY